MKTLLTAIITVLIAIGGSYLLLNHQQAKTLSGAFTPVQGTQFYLAGAGITSTSNTIQLTSFQTPDGRNLTMAMFGTAGYGSLEPGTSKLEDITFTGVTQNSNGTATLTGVSRGMDFISPYAASSTLAKAHSGGSTFILSNTAGFYGQQFALLGNAQTWGDINTFTVSPIVPTPTTAFQAVTKGYADNLAYIAGSPNAQVGVKGIVDIATALQAASSSQAGVTSSIRVLPAGLATDTPNTGSNTSDVIMSDLTGFLKQGWLNLTQAFTFSSTTSYTENVGTLTATSSASIGSATIGNLTVTGTAVLPGTMTLLFSTTTQQNMSTLISPTFTGYNHLHIVFNIKGWSAFATQGIYFNGDQGNNYSSQEGVVAPGGAMTYWGQAASQAFADVGYQIATTSPGVINMDIVDFATSKKFFTTSGAFSSNAGIPSILTGSGVWNNTSNQITQFTYIVNSGATMTAGSNISVYGYN